MNRLRYGHPCRTRFRIFKYGRTWRAVEIAQPGQQASRHSDYAHYTWEQARDCALMCLADDHALCQFMGTPREERARQ